MSGKTFKAVFICDYWQERTVWYVSSELEAQKMFQAHVGWRGGRATGRYLDIEYSFTVRELFRGDADSGLNAEVLGW